jgi:hypothetical protein
MTLFWAFLFLTCAGIIGFYTVHYCRTHLTIPRHIRVAAVLLSLVWIIEASFVLLFFIFTDMSELSAADFDYYSLLLSNSGLIAVALSVPLVGWLLLQLVIVGPGAVVRYLFPPSPQHDRTTVNDSLAQLMSWHKDHPLAPQIQKVLERHLDTVAVDKGWISSMIDSFTKALPPALVIKKSGRGETWKSYILKKIEERKSQNLDEDIRILRQLQLPIYDDLANIEVPIGVPESKRVEHHHIVAGSGHGKSECIKNLFLGDLETDAAIVVIDSQGDLINSMATRVPTERLVLFDPATCPPALNIFANPPTGEQDMSSALELYEYIFSALDAGLTSKQSLTYRFVSRLLMTVPNASIDDMRQLLEKGGEAKYQQYIDALPATARSFFQNEFKSAKATREEVLRRLYTVLENPTFERMLTAPANSFDMSDALDSGKVVLISTAKPFLKQTGASLFGRIFIAKVMQAVMARQQGNRRRTYLYIDEFQDYAEDSHVLYNLFEQSRKYNLGIIVAHQYLGQLPATLLQSIMSNTAIKFAGGVSAADARALASNMMTTPESILHAPKGTFMASFRNQYAVRYEVPFGSLERKTMVSDISAIRERMKRQYGIPSPTAMGVRKEPYSGPPVGEGSGEDYEEKSDW